MKVGLVFLGDDSKARPSFMANNLFLSKCFVCKKIAVWIHKNLILPKIKPSQQPNQDMNQDIQKDYEEAQSIINDSPRGAAALSRLCIQKLCIQLGGKGGGWMMI